VSRPLPAKARATGRRLRFCGLWLREALRPPCRLFMANTFTFCNNALQRPCQNKGGSPGGSAIGSWLAGVPNGTGKLEDLEGPRRGR
jgi:hypothetical protein